MLARMQSAKYNSDTGEIEIQLATSTTTGYQNTVAQYTTPGIIAFPSTNQVPNIDPQAQTQVQVTGYSNSIVDANYTIAAGEITNYSTNWYSSVRNSGVEIQQAQTANKENAIMGQSTNSVLADIINLQLNIIVYLQTIEDLFNTHTHSGVSSGSDMTGPVTGTAIPPTFPAPPSDTDVSNDLTYIEGNKNLAITGIYEPKG